MPTEVRRIVFSDAELYVALDRQLVKTGTSLPPGAIIRVRGDAPHDLVKIDIATSENDVAETLEFPTTQVGEALIGYCLANQIPLPRAFSKSLSITDGNVALEITNAADDPNVNAKAWRSLRRRLIDALATLSSRKWSLVRASIYGLAFQIMVIWLSDRALGASQWGLVTFDLDSGTWRGMAVAISALLPGPLLFVVAAWVRFAVGKGARRPYRYSPTTLEFLSADRHRQAAPLSTVLFALALTFSIVALGGPLVVSRFAQLLQDQQSTPGVALSGSTPGGASSVSPSSQSGPLSEPRFFGNGFSAGGSTNSGSPSPALLVQKGTIRLSGSSPVEVTFPKPFGGIPNVVVVGSGSASTEVLPRVEDVTPTSFVIRRVSGTDRGDSQTVFEWIARGSSPE